MEKNNFVSLKNVSREDISRIIDWINDKEIYENWFGQYAYEKSAHLGYEPKDMLNASEEEWNEVFHDPLQIQAKCKLLVFLVAYMKSLLTPLLVFLLY